MPIRMLIGMLVLALPIALTAGLGQAKTTGPGAGVQPGGAIDPAGIDEIVIDAIPVQGRLTDAGGNPVPDGVYEINLGLYDAEEGGNQLCFDTNWPTVTGGLFTTLFSNCTADDINGQGLWLQFQVGGEPPMTPRQQIAPVPYAWSLRPGAVISDTRTFVQLNGIMPGGSAVAGVIGKATGYNSIGVFGTTDGLGAGVYGDSTSASGWAGAFLNRAVGGVGLHASAGDGATADIELGANGTSGSEDDGRIESTEYDSSDMLLVSNDNIEFHVDDNEDEDGAFRIFTGADSQILGAYETGLLRLSIDAGWGQSIAIGDRYRDNAIIAWARVGSSGDATWEFGVASVSREGVGNYLIELDASAVGVTALIPIAIAEVESQPDTAAEARIVSINQTNYNIFRVYINNGSWAPVDNDFVFMVTAR
jgi:hypothetical protein